MQQNVGTGNGFCQKKVTSEDLQTIHLSREDFDAHKHGEGFFINVDNNAIFIPKKYVPAFGYSFGPGRRLKANFPSSNFQDKIRRHNPAMIRFTNNGITKIKDRHNQIAFQVFMRNNGLIKNSVYPRLNDEAIIALARRAKYLDKVPQPQG
jgi:hypothetical protein